MLFIENGVSGTQMTEIAQKAGIHRRTLYRYFPTKEHLVCHMQLEITAQLNDYFNRLEGRMVKTTGIDRLEEYFLLIDLNKLKDLIFLTAQFDSHFSGNYPTGEMKKEMDLIETPHTALLYKIICEGQKDGSIRKDVASDKMHQYLNNSFLALLHRILLKESHGSVNMAGQEDLYGLFIRFTKDAYSTRASTNQGSAS